MAGADDIASARASLGAQLAALRKARGYTQRAFTALLIGYSRSTVANVETGRQHVSRDFWLHCDAALAADGKLTAGHDELEAALREQQNQAADQAEAARRLRLGASPRQGTSTLTGGDSPADDVTAIRAMWQAFRMADRQVGGGHLYPTVARYLETEVGPRLVGVSSGKASSGIFCAAVALTDMAGWLAHDGGDDDRAETHLAHALRLTKAAGHTSLSANVMASMSHLALHRGQPRKAVRLARAGREKLVRGRQQPTLAARLHAMEARGLAKLQEATACHAALHEAGHVLSHSTEAEPGWLGHFDEGSMAGEAATCLRQLGDLGKAERQAERAVALRGGDQVRSRAFARLTLASIHAQRGELESACQIGHEVLAAAMTMASARVSERLYGFGRRLLPHHEVRVVADFLEALAAVRLPGVDRLQLVLTPGT